MVLNALYKSVLHFHLGPPSCSANVTSVRIDNFTSTTVTWQQPPNTPPVTFTTVTYCPTSSPNCGESMNCTSPCTISGLDPCLNYSIILTVTNNCGSFTGCTGSMVAAKGYYLGVYTVYSYCILMLMCMLVLECCSFVCDATASRFYCSYNADTYYVGRWVLVGSCGFPCQIIVHVNEI